MSHNYDDEYYDGDEHNHHHRHGNEIDVPDALAIGTANAINTGQQGLLLSDAEMVGPYGAGAVAEDGSDYDRGAIDARHHHAGSAADVVDRLRYSDTGFNDGGYTDEHAARHAAEVLRKRDFYTDGDGGLVGAPTNLTVDANGMVHDATGVVVGRAGEVFVDANGNAINATGQIVGRATRPVNAILDDARTGESRGATSFDLGATDSLADAGLVPGTYAAPEFETDSARGFESLGSAESEEEFGDGETFGGKPFGVGATDGLLP